MSGGADGEERATTPQNMRKIYKALMGEPHCLSPNQIDSLTFGQLLLYLDDDSGGYDNAVKKSKANREANRAKNLMYLRTGLQKASLPIPLNIEELSDAELHSLWSEAGLSDPERLKAVKKSLGE